MLKSRAAACENACVILARRSLEYLIKERVVPPLDPGPVGLSTHMDLHHRFDVVSRQLTGLDDPNTNLRGGKKKKKRAVQLLLCFKCVHAHWPESPEVYWLIGSDSAPWPAVGGAKRAELGIRGCPKHRSGPHLGKIHHPLHLHLIRGQTRGWKDECAKKKRALTTAALTGIPVSTVALPSWGLLGSGVELAGGS